MNNNIFIKICGIQTSEHAKHAALAGADFIGIVFHPFSRRYCNLKQAKLVSKAAYLAGAQPVAIFTDQTAPQMQEICIQNNIHIIQLHGRTAKQQHYLLDKTYIRFYIQNIFPDGRFEKEDEKGLQHCLPSRDFLILDNILPGSGKAHWQHINQKNIPINYSHKLGLAGGLNNHNIKKAIKIFQPALIDISSGVENDSGQKENALITDFIHTVKNYHSNISGTNSHDKLQKIF